MALPIDPACLNEDAIQRKAALLGLTIADENQIQFLKRTDSFDLQAAPGCGKTTLTGLKLCLLASGWNEDQPGVCVLSHTNVAKDQIINILRSDADGQRFLSYPNYIGTIQGFIDTFLAMPHLRSKGIEVRIVDSDIYERVARSELRKIDAYPTLKGIVRAGRRTDIEPLIHTAQYLWVNGEMVINGFVNGRSTAFPFGSGAASTREFVALKEAVSEKGFFGFLDMYAFASQYLVNNGSIGEALKQRFPFVLIDEMQDTSKIQDELLELVFGEQCVVQRIGDVNQKIYSDSQTGLEESSFPKPGFDSLPRSNRFGASIALAASPLTHVSPQQIEGNPKQPDTPPILIVFDNKSVETVLQTFAGLVYECFGSEAARMPIKAVCARKTGGANEFPTKLGSYWPQYQGEAARMSRPTCLIQAVQKAQLCPGESWERRASTLMEACCDILSIWGFRFNGRRATPASLRRYLLTLSASVRGNIRELLLMSLQLNLEDQSAWEEYVTSILDALRSIFRLVDAPENVLRYCGHQQDLIVPEAEAAICTKAVFDFEDSQITVELATIHAVKGETHGATLVLESFSHVYDLKEVLPILVNRHDPQRIIRTASIGPAIRTTFVAMTRPRYLLAFAVLKSHIEPCMPSFRELGWTVIDVT